jgi:hypothetical protein
LLGGLSANGTLGGKSGGNDREKQDEEYQYTPLFHILQMEGQKYDEMAGNKKAVPALTERL